MVCQRAQGWGEVACHDIERKRRRFRQARDQTDIRETGREEPVSSSFRNAADSSGSRISPRSSDGRSTVRPAEGLTAR